MVFVLDANKKNANLRLIRKVKMVLNADVGELCLLVEFFIWHRAANMTQNYILGQSHNTISASVYFVHSSKSQTSQCRLVAAVQVGFH